MMLHRELRSAMYAARVIVKHEITKAGMRLSHFTTVEIDLAATEVIIQDLKARQKRLEKILKARQKAESEVKPRKRLPHFRHKKNTKRP